MILFKETCFQTWGVFKNRGVLLNRVAFPKPSYKNEILKTNLHKEKMPVTTNAMIKENDYFISPFRMILSGSSGAGKKTFCW